MWGRIRRVGLFATFIAILVNSAVRADTIELLISINTDTGVPCAGLPMRVVVGSEPDSRGVNAGARLKTDRSCWIRRSVEAPVERRWSIVDSLIPQRVDAVSVGVEPALGSRPTLYWISVADDRRRGPWFEIDMFVQGRSGAFDTALKRVRPGVWRFPDQRGEPPMDDIGLQVSSWVLQRREPPGGQRRWVVDHSLRVQAFTRR